MVIGLISIDSETHDNRGKVTILVPFLFVLTKQVFWFLLSLWIVVVGVF